MKIGYIKLDKPKEGIINLIKYNIEKIFNYVKKDKYNKENYYLINLNEKSKRKLINMLYKDKINYIVEEKDLNINYPKLSGNFALKYMLPEVIKYCFNLTKPKVEEIYICTNKYISENIEIIKDLTSHAKVVNIVSNNGRYKILEKEFEKQGIYITVNNNKRKTLKKANIVVNLDFMDIDEYIINQNMIIIDITNHLYLKKGFDGIYIRGIVLETDKIKRIFNEYKNFNKNELIESEMIKIEKYSDVRKYIEMNKFNIKKVIGKRIINEKEFERIGKMVS